YRQSNLEGFQCRLVFGDDFEISDEDGNPARCDVDRGAVTGRFRFKPQKKYWLDLQYRHIYFNGGRQDLSAIAIATAKLAPEMRVRGRLRWFWQDIEDNGNLPQTVWAYFDLTYRLRAKDQLRLRYDYIYWRDDRESTFDRSPNPEHWLWFQYEAKF
ncbi:MAG: hypothetical protein KJO07_07140, partial [Deltaproteobacteria bacterium]|nr:hypothetical protein [Deltaproteobacteria bacterium]